MRQVNDYTSGDLIAAPTVSPWRRLFRSRDGAAAIEFALLAIPYFLIIFAILETFIAFTGEQMVANAVDTMGRKLRTGSITFNMNRPSTDMTETQFRRAFCDEVSILIKCSEQEIVTADRLLLDVRSFPNFADIPTAIPRTPANARYGKLDTSGMKFAPGGAKTINMLRVYYRWQVITDLVRPYITNVRPDDGSSSNYFLIMETTAFQNENYP